jgi:hypothetical protein
MILQDLDALLYYFDTNDYVQGKPYSTPSNLTDIAKILARLTLLLVGADACTPYIIDKVWGEDENARQTLGGPCGDLSLIHRRILTHQKVAINTVHIWLTNPQTPVLPPQSEAFKLLPCTVQQLLLDCSNKKVFVCKPVPSGARSIQRLTDNLQNYIIPNTTPFEHKAIRWYSDLLLGRDRADDMTGFDNGIIVAFGMCPPCTLQEFYDPDPNLPRPTHFIRGTANEIWGEETDPYGVMQTTAVDWTDNHEGATPLNLPHQH